MRISDWSSDVCSSDLLAQTMGLVDDDQISARKSALLDRLRTADLNTFVRAIAPVPCLHHAVRNVAQIFIAELIAQNDAIANESNARSEEHTSALQSLMRISYAVFCLKK